MDVQARILSVLHIVPTIDVCSAPYNEHALARMNHHDITICTYFLPDLEAAKGIRLIAGNGTISGFYRAMKRALDANSYDVIHIHVPSDGFLFILASPFLGSRLLRSTVCTIHNCYRGFDFKNRFLLAWILIFFERIISCGIASYESFPGFYKWLGGKRFEPIQNGVDMARVDRAIEENGIQSSNGLFTTVSAGRLIELKNPDVVLRAFHQAQVQNSRLIFIGRGILQSSLETTSIKLGIQKQVKITGIIPRESVYEYLASSDLFVSASRVEGLPLAALEAMTSRCPVILSDIPSHREIAAGVDFIPLVQLDDVSGFTREIEKFRQMPAAQRAEVGERCRQLVERRFSLAKMHKEYDEVYSELAGKLQPDG